MDGSGSSSATSLSRRSVLRSFAPLASVALAGCEGPCFLADIDHSLSLAVDELERPAGGFELGVTLQNDEKERDGRQAEFANITLHLFSFELDEVATQAAGRLSYGEARTERVAVDRLPAFVTAEVGTARVRTDAACREIRTQEHVLGYAGRQVTGGGSAAHQWVALGHRRPRDDLPLAERWRERLKCEHRKARWNGQSPTPDLTALGREPTWLENPIESPQITRVYEASADVVTEADDRRFEQTDNTLQLETLAPDLRAFVTGGSSEYVPRRRYFDLVSAFEGRQIRTLPELPAYRRGYVEGRNSRRVGGVRHCGFVGSYNKYLWYYVEGETDLYYVVLNYRENRNRDRLYMQFEPECEDWAGVYEVLFYRPDAIGVWTATQAVRVSDTPEALFPLLETVEERRGHYFDREEWFDVLQQLGAGRTVPSGDAPHVDVEFFDNCHGGTGRELWAYYRLLGETPEWVMALRYRERLRRGGSRSS